MRIIRCLYRSTSLRIPIDIESKILAHYVTFFWISELSYFFRLSYQIKVSYAPFYFEIVEFVNKWKYLKSFSRLAMAWEKEKRDVHYFNASYELIRRAKFRVFHGIFFIWLGKWIYRDKLFWNVFNDSSNSNRGFSRPQLTQ